jgi:GR25 family glycosyltransferase involved in LPS biosynthesis
MDYSKGLNNIDLVYYINLNHRTDRLEHIKAELQKTNIDQEKIHRVEAVYLKDFGMLGCSKSHVLAVESFLNSDESNKTCLILEDDFIFTQSQDAINDVINKVFNELKVFDVIMFASNTMNETQTEFNFVTKIIDAQTTSSYLLHRNFAKKLLENYKDGVTLLENYSRLPDYFIDMYMKKLQPTSNWYCLYPKIGKQMASYSDIEKNNADYNC